MNLWAGFVEIGLICFLNSVEVVAIRWSTFLRKSIAIVFWYQSFIFWYNFYEHICEKSVKILIPVDYAFLPCLYVSALLFHVYY